MKNLPKAPKLLLSLGLIASLNAVSGIASALASDEGWYIETINRSTGLTGDTPTEETSKTYVGDDKMKIVSSDPQGTDMIVDPTTGTLTFLNDEAKQYYKVDTNSMKESMSQPGMEQMRAVLEQSKVSVEPTDETREINGWKCKKYLVNKTGMMEVEQEVWATEDVDLDTKRFTSLMSMSGPQGLLADSPAGKAQREEMAKIKGFPILTKSKVKMLGASMETESEVTLIRKEPMPADLFEIPKGYTPKDMRPAGGHEAQEKQS